jgi:repressor LexA
VKNGDIVVALLGGETTVKRYKETSAGIFLVPENKKMKPIKVTDKTFRVQGKVVGLQRKL